MREKTIAYMLPEWKLVVLSVVVLLLLQTAKDRHDLVEYEEQDIGHDNHE